jgi:hypothetical protein
MLISLHATKSLEERMQLLQARVKLAFACLEHLIAAAHNNGRIDTSLHWHAQPLRTQTPALDRRSCNSRQEGSSVDGPNPLQNV